jgi:hypothetical protein
MAGIVLRGAIELHLLCASRFAHRVDRKAMPQNSFKMVQSSIYEIPQIAV